MSLFLRLIEKEGNAMCSEKKKSILRKCQPDELLEFTFDKLDNEMKEDCPTFREILLTFAHKKETKTKKVNQDPHVFRKVGRATSICLQCRSRKMRALEYMIDKLEKGSNEGLPPCILALRYCILPSEVNDIDVDET